MSRIIEINNDSAFLKTTYLDNQFIDDEYKRTLENLQDENEYYYKVYALGEFGVINLKGRVYYNFSEYNILEHNYNSLFNIIVCIDFNVTPMKWALVQCINGIDYVFDEIVKSDTTTEEMMIELINRYGNLSYEFYGDYSGTQRHTSSRTTDWEIIKQYSGASSINIKPNPPVISRTNAVNVRLKNNKQIRRLFISPKCKHLIDDFNKVKYLEGKREIDKRDRELTHISDALGYYIEYKYSLKGQAEIKIYN